MARSQGTRVGLLGIIVTGTALIFVINQIDPGLFWQSLVLANYWYVLPSVALLLLGLVTRALRWQTLLGGQLPLRRTFSIMNVAYMVNGVLPLRLGELARIYLVRRAEPALPAAKTAATIVVERLLDLLAVVLMVFLALLFGSVPVELETASRAAALFGIVGIVGLLVLIWQRSLMRQIARMIEDRLPFLRRYFSLTELADHFLDGLTPLTKSHALIGVLLWTVVSWVISTAAGYVLMLAFWEEGSLAATMLYIAAAAFAIAVPAVPGNIGTYEASILLALTALGYTQSNQAAAFAMTVHAVNVVVHVSTGIVGFIQEGVSLAQLSQGVQEIRQTDTQAGSRV